MFHTLSETHAGIIIYTQMIYSYLFQCALSSHSIICCHIPHTPYHFVLCCSIVEKYEKAFFIWAHKISSNNQEIWILLLFIWEHDNIIALLEDFYLLSHSFILFLAYFTVKDTLFERVSKRLWLEANFLGCDLIKM